MTIKEQIKKIKCLIEESAIECGRSPQSIQLLAVSKGQPSTAIREAFKNGLSNFAENYWQEAEAKMRDLQDLELFWHFIGPIQSNKTPQIANSFSWVHSLSREKIAVLLARHRESTLPPLNVCIQVNLDNEETKSGCSIQDLSSLIQLIQNLPTLRLRGLMAIPLPLKDMDAQFLSLIRLKKLLEKLNQQLNLNMDTLSMGMSDDLVAAIRAGATIVRVGRAIFGERA